MGLLRVPDGGKAGVEVFFYRSSQEVELSAWNGVGRIRGERLPLREFLERLGISLDDCRKALKHQEVPAELRPLLTIEDMCRLLGIPESVYQGWITEGQPAGTCCDYGPRGAQGEPGNAPILDLLETTGEL